MRCMGRAEEADVDAVGAGIRLADCRVRGGNAHAEQSGGDGARGHHRRQESPGAPSQDFLSHFHLCSSSVSVSDLTFGRSSGGRLSGTANLAASPGANIGQLTYFPTPRLVGFGLTTWATRPNAQARARGNGSQRKPRAMEQTKKHSRTCRVRPFSGSEARGQGDPSGAGTGVVGNVPPWSNRALSVGVVTVAKRLHAVFRYRHPMFGREAAARFADRYVDTIDWFLAL